MAWRIVPEIGRLFRTMRCIKCRAETRLESRATTIRKMTVRMWGSLQIRQSTAASLAGFLVEPSARCADVSLRRIGPAQRSAEYCQVSLHAAQSAPHAPW
jgi:hypothetical protein